MNHNARVSDPGRRWKDRLLGRRVVTPCVLQFEAAECGSASLCMILAYYGRHVPLETLRTMCGISRDGSKATNILKAARSFGLEAKGLKAEPYHLRELALPAIAFVDFCHFLVIEGHRGNWVYLNDPASGRRKVHMDEFDAMFTGVVLTFRPTEEFVASDDRPSLVKALLARTTGVRLSILYVLIASLALVLPGLALPVMARVFVDFVLVQGLDDWLNALLIGMVLTAVVRFVLLELRNWTLTVAETRLAVDGASDLLQHILRLPIAFFGSRFAGEVATRLHLSDGLAYLLTGQIAQIALNLITAVFFLALMLFYDLWIAIIVFVLAALNFAAVLIAAHRVAEAHRKLSIDAGKLSGVAIAGLRDVESFKAAGSEDAFFLRWSGLHAGIVSTDQEIGRQMALLAAVPQLLTLLATASILIIGGQRVMQGDITIGTLVALQTLAASFMAPVVSLSAVGHHLQQVRSFTERTDDVLQQPLDQQAATWFEPVDRLPRGSISLENVSFGYLPLEPPFISDFSLQVPQGTSVALVGASGSGKSTMGRLLTGLFRAHEGAIMVDNVLLEDWPRAALAGSISYVDQEILLFEGSVHDNLSLWDDTIPEAQIITAAQDAQIHDVVAGRPGTYDSLVEEGGRNFSGGQMQRLEIARALATNPRILVLDEATSALDAETEAEVMKNIRARGITMVIIAHRLSTIRDCDRIIVFEQGKPVESGTHKELMRTGGRYAELIEV